MIEESVIVKMKERYAEIPPLIFHRSLERANDSGDLFDILESFPKDGFPVVWNEKTRRWATSPDISQQGKFQIKK